MTSGRSATRAATAITTTGATATTASAAATTGTARATTTTTRATRTTARPAGPALLPYKTFAVHAHVARGRGSIEAVADVVVDIVAIVVVLVVGVHQGRGLFSGAQDVAERIVVVVHL